MLHTAANSFDGGRIPLSLPHLVWLLVLGLRPILPFPFRHLLDFLLRFFILATECSHHRFLIRLPLDSNTYRPFVFAHDTEALWDWYGKPREVNNICVRFFYLSATKFFFSLLLSFWIFVPLALETYKKHPITTPKKWSNRCKCHRCICVPTNR